MADDNKHDLNHHRHHHRQDNRLHPEERDGRGQEEEEQVRELVEEDGKMSTDNGGPVVGGDLKDVSEMRQEKESKSGPVKGDTSTKSDNDESPGQEDVSAKIQKSKDGLPEAEAETPAPDGSSDSDEKGDKTSSNDDFDFVQIDANEAGTKSRSSSDSSSDKNNGMDGSKTGDDEDDDDEDEEEEDKKDLNVDDFFEMNDEVEGAVKTDPEPVKRELQPTVPQDDDSEDDKKVEKDVDAEGQENDEMDGHPYVIDSGLGKDQTETPEMESQSADSEVSDGGRPKVDESDYIEYNHREDAVEKAAPEKESTNEGKKEDGLTASKNDKDDENDTNSDDSSDSRSRPKRDTTVGDIDFDIDGEDDRGREQSTKESKKETPVDVLATETAASAAKPDHADDDDGSQADSRKEHSDDDEDVCKKPETVTSPQFPKNDAESVEITRELAKLELTVASQIQEKTPETPANTPAATQAESPKELPHIAQIVSQLVHASPKHSKSEEIDESKAKAKDEDGKDYEADVDLNRNGTELDVKQIDRASSPRNSFRGMKKKRRQTQTIPRPQDIKIVVSDHEGGVDEDVTGAPEKPPRNKITESAAQLTPLSPDSDKLSVPGEPGPEDFEDIPIDVEGHSPTLPSKRITFDLPDNGSDGSKSSFKKFDDEDGEDKQLYEKSKTEKFLNYLLCRTDLVDAKLSEKPVDFWDLFKYGSKLDMFLVIVALLLAMLCGMCQPFFAVLSGRLANTLLLMDPSEDQFYEEGRITIILFVIVGVVLCVLAFAQFCCFNVACTRITRRIRTSYLKSILRQNAAWFEKNHSGALNTKLNDNIERIYEGIGDKLGLLTRNGFQYITGIVVAMFTCWQMTVPLLIFSPMIAFLMSLSSRKIIKASKAEMAVYATAGTIAEETITAYRTVAAFNAQDFEVKRYRKELQKGLEAGLRKGMYSGGLTGVLMALVMLFMGVALLYGTFLHSIDVITSPGQIFTVLMAIMSGAYHLGTASPHLMVLLQARVAAATVYKTIERVPKIDPYSPNGRKLYDLQGKIIFKKVNFRYPTRPDTKVLKSLSFSVHPGQTVALVGSSGSGKSTVVGILNRLYEFERGTVTIDGVDIRDLNVHWLRSAIGTVQQEPIIFNDTVESNIRHGNATVTEKDMVDACKMANAHEFIEHLPDGYKTRIGDGGVQLSGGQKQRIAIARTLARNPKILLLDEATSALDTHSEALVQNALNKAAMNRTTIVIAHRLSTIRDADLIIVMHKGRFLESGSHNDLLRRKGAYSRLVQAQELDMSSDKDLPVSDLESPEAVSPDGAPAFGMDHMQVHQPTLRESLRQSFQRDFMFSEHLGDAEQQQLELEVNKAGITPASFGQILLDNRDLWNILGCALAVCVFNSLAMPLNALVYGKSFQMFENGRKDNIGEAAIFLGFFIAIGVVAFVASGLTTYLFGKIGETVTMNMRIRAFKTIISQDGAYFDNPAHTPGKLISRLATDAPNVKASMDTRLARVVQGVMSLVSAIIISMFIEVPYAAACSVIFVLLGFFQFFVAKIVHSKALKFAESDDAGRLAIEAIENVRTIQLLTAEFDVYNRFNEASLLRQSAEVGKAPIEAINFATTHGLQYFTLAFSYMVGFIFVSYGWIDKIALFQVAQTMYFGAISVLQATEFFPEFVKSRLAASLMYNIINREPRIGRSSDGEKIVLEGEVNLENVYFAYPMRPKNAVMKGINVHAKPGQTIALVGPSGSGKSTVIALLERLYDPSVGTVKLDGRDLKTLCLDDVRNQMSLVEQTPRLFSGTIKENIAYGLDLDRVTMDDIVEAAKIANAASFISSMPLGYETELGEKGAQLSGGQKQRIAIARAMIRKPKILLLDEATSALDSTAERAVQDALDKCREGKTCLTIAHRLSSIQNSDQIIFVENGFVRERGTHAQLIQMKGKYYNLIQQQNLGIQ